MYTLGDIGHVSVSQIDSGGNSDRQGNAFRHIPDGVYLVCGHGWKGSIGAYACAYLRKVGGDIAGGKGTDATGIEIYLFASAGRDKLFVASFDAAVAQALLQAGPEVVATGNDPANALSCRAHDDAQEIVAFVDDLVGVKEDEEGEIFREVAQIVAQAQAKFQVWFQVIAQAYAELLLQSGTKMNDLFRRYLYACSSVAFHGVGYLLVIQQSLQHKERGARD